MDQLPEARAAGYRWIAWLALGALIIGLLLGLLQPLFAVAVGGFGVVAAPSPLGLLFLASVAVALIGGIGILLTRRRGGISLVALSLSLALGLLGGNAIAAELRVGYAFPQPLPTPLPPDGQGWSAAGQMLSPRHDHTATLLGDGRVLVAGGEGSDSTALSSSELFDPDTGLWTQTGGMVVASARHTATLLLDGRVLLTSASGEDAQLYDPRTGTWNATARMTVPRNNYAVALLPDGSVLVTGGQSPATGDVLASAEVYDPATEAWDVTTDMSAARYFHTATLLADGRVLVAGGLGTSPSSDGPNPGLASAELYDPAAATWTPTGTMQAEHSGHAAARLDDGTVFLAGGTNLLYADTTTAELFDPGTGEWRTTGATTDFGPHTAVLLPDGRVLLVGGFLESLIVSYGPIDWSSPTELANARHGAGATATLLGDGRLLVAGGVILRGYDSDVLATAHLLTP